MSDESVISTEQWNYLSEGLRRQNADLQKANNEYLKRARDAEAQVLWLERALREALARHTVDNLEKLDAQVSSLR
jgi:hypothetical protein